MTHSLIDELDAYMAMGMTADEAVWQLGYEAGMTADDRCREVAPAIWNVSNVLWTAHKNRGGTPGYMNSKLLRSW